MKLMLLVSTIVYGLPIVYAITEDEQIFINTFFVPFPREADWRGLNLNHLCRGDLYSCLANIEISQAYYPMWIKVCCNKDNIFGMAGSGNGELFYLKVEKFNPQSIYERGLFTVESISLYGRSDDYSPEMSNVLMWTNNTTSK